MKVSKSTIRDRPANLAATPPLVSDEKSLQFLLREHERIAGLYEAGTDSYHRRFDVWLAAFSAGFVGVVTLADKLAAPIRSVFIVAILAALLVLGLNVFMSLATSSVLSAHYLRAIILIQNCFVRRDGCVDAYLYFQHHTVGLTGTDFLSVAKRGLAGGGLKSILVLANSATACGLVLALPDLFGQRYIIPPLLIVVLVFVLSCSLQVAYSVWYYGLHERLDDASIPQDKTS